VHVNECASCRKTARRSRRFCCLRPKKPKINAQIKAQRANSKGRVLGEGQVASPHQQENLGKCCKLPQGVWGRAPAAQQFSCIFRSPSGFLRYVTIQKFLNLAAREGYAKPLGGQKLHKQGAYNP